MPRSCSRIACSDAAADISVPDWLVDPSLLPEPDIIKKEKPVLGGFLFFRSGGDLLSHTVSRAVSSAWRVLTSVFGMETGVALALLLPENSLNCSPDPPLHTTGNLFLRAGRHYPPALKRKLLWSSLTVN